VDKKLNRITERLSEQFTWRSSKLGTTVDDSSTIVWKIKEDKK